MWSPVWTAEKREKIRKLRKARKRCLCVFPIYLDLNPPHVLFCKKMEFGRVTTDHFGKPVKRKDTGYIKQHPKFTKTRTDLLRLSPGGHQFYCCASAASSRHTARRACCCVSPKCPLGPRANCWTCPHDDPAETPAFLHICFSILYPVARQDTGWMFRALTLAFCYPVSCGSLPQGLHQTSTTNSTLTCAPSHQRLLRVPNFWSS